MQYYAVVKGKYYLMTKTNSGISISKTATELDNSSNSATLTATSNNSYVTVGTISGNTITLNGGSNVGSSTITVSYGTYSATCVASIVVTPTSTSVANAEITFSTEYGTIDVVWLDTSNKIISIPNAPVLSSNGESMTPVTWTYDKSTSTWSEDTTASSDWYSYNAVSSRNEDGSTTDNLTSRWANAKTKNGSYFVWIPRFAYRITYYSSAKSTTPTGYYDGWGMWKATDGTVKYALDSGIETVEDSKGNKYIVHPAFETNLDNGGWSADLPGFWFAKFEMSGTGTTLTSTYGSESIRSQTIGVEYTSGRQATYGYTGTTDTDGNTSFMSSHMMKNSEWGAVAYLTQSQYGRNGNEITINSTSYYRGGGYGTAYIDNVNQSTTGNVYGIYDMSGGVWERTATFNSVDSNGYFSTYGWKEATGLTVDSSSTKYATKYTNTSGSSYGNAVVYSYGKVGDATKEVNKGGDYYGSSTTYYCNWFSDASYFTYSDEPFFSRGGNCFNGSSTGVFDLFFTDGKNRDSYSFRTMLCP
jgi:hypothetical protein